MKEDVQRKRVLSGIKPTGRPHLGNYFGMMKPLVSLQEEYDTFIFIADYHALTSIHDRETLHDLSVQIILDYLAIGVDPDKSVFYLQSAIPELNELTWIFNTLMTVPWLERSHAYKDALANGKEATIGLFDYPVLMASDILLPQAELIPVGKDQIQHIEMTREIARKFNKTYGETFKEPKELINEQVAIVPGIDGRKMSKSYNNTIPLFAPEAEIKKAVMRIVTDSLAVDEKKNPETCNVFALHKLVSPKEEVLELEEAYRNGSIGYGESKKRLLKNLLLYMEEMRNRRKFYEDHMELVYEIIKKGNEQVRSICIPFMEEIREKVGFLS